MAIAAILTRSPRVGIEKRKLWSQVEKSRSKKSKRSVGVERVLYCFCADVMVEHCREHDVLGGMTAQLGTVLCCWDANARGGLRPRTKMSEWRTPEGAERFFDALPIRDVEWWSCNEDVGLSHDDGVLVLGGVDDRNSASNTISEEATSSLAC